MSLRRCMSNLVALVTLTSSLALAPVAPAAEPTLMDLMRDVSRSIEEVNDSTLAVIEARQAYDAQLAAVQAAARDLAKVFANEAPASPRLAALRLAPTSRLAALLSKTPRLDALRPSDPNGTSIYDSLTFTR